MEQCPDGERKKKKKPPTEPFSRPVSSLTYRVLAGRIEFLECGASITHLQSQGFFWSNYWSGEGSTRRLQTRLQIGVEGETQGSSGRSQTNLWELGFFFVGRTTESSNMDSLEITAHLGRYCFIIDPRVKISHSTFQLRLVVHGARKSISPSALGAWKRFVPMTWWSFLIVPLAMSGC